MATVRTTATLTFTGSITLTEVEMRALDGLVGYGDDAFLEHFKKNLGAAYIRNHEDGLRSFFAAVRRDVLPAIRDINVARKDLEDAALLRFQERQKKERPT